MNYRTSGAVYKVGLSDEVSFAAGTGSAGTGLTFDVALTLPQAANRSESSLIYLLVPSPELAVQELDRTLRQTAPDSDPKTAAGGPQLRTVAIMQAQCSS